LNIAKRDIDYLIKWIQEPNIGESEFNDLCVKRKIKRIVEELLK